MAPFQFSGLADMHGKHNTKNTHRLKKPGARSDVPVVWPKRAFISDKGIEHADGFMRGMT